MEQPTTSNNNASQAFSYDDLFPALPESATPKFPAAVASNNIKRIGSTVVTQVIFFNGHFEFKFFFIETLNSKN